MSDIETPSAPSCAFPAVSGPQGALDRIRRFGPSFTLALFRNSQDSVSLLSVDGVIEYMNPNGLALLGFDRSDEIAGLAWDTMWLPEARTKVLATLKTGPERCARAIRVNFGLFERARSALHHHFVAFDRAGRSCRCSSGGCSQPIEPKRA